MQSNREAAIKASQERWDALWAEARRELFSGVNCEQFLDPCPRDACPRCGGTSAHFCLLPPTDPTMKTDQPTPLDERRSCEDRLVQPLLDETEKAQALAYYMLRKADWTDDRAQRALKKAGWWL